MSGVIDVRERRMGGVVVSDCVDVGMGGRVGVVRGLRVVGLNATCAKRIYSVSSNPARA